MKKIIVLSAVAALFAINCKKKIVPVPGPPVDTQTYCIYGYIGTTKTFYKCVQGKDAANTAYNELTAQGKEAVAEAKNSCSDCH